MSLKELPRIGIVSGTITLLSIIEAPIITTLCSTNPIMAGILWILMMVGSYCIGRVLSEQLIKG